MKKAFTQADWIKDLREGKSVYDYAELRRLSGLSDLALRKAIQRLLKKKLLLRLRPKLYLNSFKLLSLEEVASLLYPPAYISLESALFIQGIIEQAPHLLTCVSTNKTKIFKTDLGEIAYFHLKKDLFFGYEIRKGIALAWPEKAALDYIYLQLQNGLKPSLDEWNWQNLNIEKFYFLSEPYPQTVRELARRFIPNRI